MISLVDDGTDSVGKALDMSAEDIRKMRPANRSSEEVSESLQNAVTTADELLNRCSQAHNHACKMIAFVINVMRGGQELLTRDVQPGVCEEERGE
jgi:hypothetical protein